MCVTRTRLSSLACQKDAAGAERRLRLLGPAIKKIGSGSTLKVAAPGGSGPATLVRIDVDTVSIKSTTIRSHNVHVVNDYADSDFT